MESVFLAVLKTEFWNCKERCGQKDRHQCF